MNGEIILSRELQDNPIICHSPTTFVKEQTYRRARLWLAAMDIFSLDR